MMSVIRLGLVLGAVAIASMAVATEGFFNSKGVKIRYVSAGEGEAVVLVHGWMGDSSMWGRDAAGNTKLDASAVPGFQFIALDCRGHGKSDKPHDERQYGPEMAEDIVRLLDHLKIKKAHLVGYSMGAFLIGMVAAKHPERVLSLVYGGQAPILGQPRKASVPEVQMFADLVKSGKGLGAYVTAFYPPDKPKPTPQQADAIAQFLYGKKDVEALAAAGLSFKNLAVPAEALGKCKAPALFLYGEKDLDAQASVEAAMKVVSHGEVKVIPGADHMSAPAHAMFGASLIKFLQDHATSLRDKPSHQTRLPTPRPLCPVERRAGPFLRAGLPSL